MTIRFPMGDPSEVIAGVQDFYEDIIAGMAADAEALAQLHNLDDDQTNAIAHAGLR